MQKYQYLVQKLAYIIFFLYLCVVKRKKGKIMSVAQLRASERFISAMGPMVNDEKKMEQVLLFINTLSSDHKADGSMTRAERDSNFMLLEDSEKSTLAMVRNHFHPVTA